MTMKSSAAMSENGNSGDISASPVGNLLPRKHNKAKQIRTKWASVLDSENTPPGDLNIPINKTKASASIPSKSSSKYVKEVTKSDAKEDPPVKVVVRIKPVKDHEWLEDRCARKVSSDSLLVGDRRFDFSSVFDSGSTQDEIFQSIGVPLVKSALAGYNTSILSYGQTGSGKTYTMWGPPSAMVEGHSSSDQQGIVPRIFQALFSEIQKEQDNSEGKQMNYQCRCSFLEIYNERIGDLIDPIQRDLEIADDAKYGFYVRSLTEEYVNSYEDVMQILIKGLSSRKVGATSLNSKSSRSHVVFTCVIESWCKGNLSNCFTSSKTSRISLVDLAGPDGVIIDDANKQLAKEEKNVKKSLSQLGHVVSALAEGTRFTNLEDVPYKSSCLTHLLRESLGGNAKLTVICAISSDNRNVGQTLSTIRFGQLAKSINNDPVVNEITEDDVNGLSDQIRQLKEELIRAKSSSYSVGSGGYFKGRNIRDSLNQLRVSLNRSLILPRIEDDTKEEVHVDEDDVKELCVQLDDLQSSGEKKSNPMNVKIDEDDTELSEHFVSCLEDSEFEECNKESSNVKFPDEVEVAASVESFSSCIDDSRTINSKLNTRLSISLPCQTTVLEEPTMSESPKIGNVQRKSTVFSSTLLEKQNNVSESLTLNPNVLQNSLKKNDIARSLRSSKIVAGSTQSLAASLQRGLQIIDDHQKQHPSSNKSSVAFSFQHLTLKPSPAVDTADASIQTATDDVSSTSFLCASCRERGLGGSTEKESADAAVDHAGTLIEQPPKGAGGDLAETIKREKDLEKVCMEQASKIEELNHLVEHYRNLREHNSISDHCEHHPPQNEETKLLGYNDEQEVKTGNCETKVLEKEDYDFRNDSDANEKETLLKEIQSLRSKLQANADQCPDKSVQKLRSSLLRSSTQWQKSGASANSEEELERERERWTEMESDWISLTDELRIDLESHRRRAEKVEMDLRSEKKCTEELDDALTRAVLGHARMVEHYADLQEKHNDVVEKLRVMMEGIAEVKRAAAKAGSKGGKGPRFAKALAAELSALRLDREKERDHLKKENRSLRIQLKDTAEAVHAAGELLVRLREAEEAASAAEGNFLKGQQENEKLKKQLEKAKRKHKMEMITMKQYLAESRLPESALQPLYRQDSDPVCNNNANSPADDDQAWRAEFGAIYEDKF